MHWSLLKQAAKQSVDGRAYEAEFVRRGLRMCIVKLAESMNFRDAPDAARGPNEKWHWINAAWTAAGYSSNKHQIDFHGENAADAIALVVERLPFARKAVASGRTVNIPGDSGRSVLKLVCGKGNHGPRVIYPTITRWLAGQNIPFDSDKLNGNVYLTMQRVKKRGGARRN